MPANLPKIVALVSGLGWHVDDLRRAAGRVGVDFTPVGFGRLNGRVGGGGPFLSAGGVDFREVDAVLLRMMPPGGLEPVVFRMDALQRLEREGVRVLNPPRGVEISVDKYLSLALLERAGLPVPPTFASERADDALAAFDELGEDVVVKPLFGSEGRGLVRLTDREVARRVFHALERVGSVLYVQKTVRNPGHDVRAFVLGGRVLGAFRRHAAAGDWRTNVALGGRAEACGLDDGWARLALEAADATGAVMAGVDLMADLDRGGPVVLEVNAVPGWRALASANGLDVAAEILAFLKEGRP